MSGTEGHRQLRWTCRRRGLTRSDATHAQPGRLANAAHLSLLRLQELGRLLVEGDELGPTEQFALVGNGAVGKVAP